MSGGRPRSKPTKLEAVVAQGDLPVASEAKRDLVRFMLPILVPEVDWEAVDGVLGEGRQCTRQRHEAKVRELEDRIARLQNERMSLLREAV